MPISQDLRGHNSGLTPTALSVPHVVEVLSRSGARLATEERVEADIRAGAPVNPDGTINLIQYTAWLAREVAHGD